MTCPLLLNIQFKNKYITFCHIWYAALYMKLNAALPHPTGEALLMLNFHEYLSVDSHSTLDDLLQFEVICKKEFGYISDERGGFQYLQKTIAIQLVNHSAMIPQAQLHAYPIPPHASNEFPRTDAEHKTAKHPMLQLKLYLVKKSEQLEPSPQNNK